MSRAITLRRLNLDATWWVSLGEVGVIFDPWLVGPEVDVAPWFHVAWHTGPVVPPAEAPPHGVIVVSQVYADHDHTPTLAALPGEAVVAAVPEAVASVRAARPGSEVRAVPPWGAAPLRVGALRLWRLTRPWWRPPRYHAVIVADEDGRAVVHAPHGLPASEAARVAGGVDVRVLATTRQRYQLPWWLGGLVNPGPEVADAAARALGSPRVLVIHDEAKREAGLVARLARVEREALPDAHLDPIEA